MDIKPAKTLPYAPYTELMVVDPDENIPVRATFRDVAENGDRLVELHGERNVLRRIAPDKVISPLRCGS